MSRTNSATERVAPEVQAARALFTPDNQKQIERLADDLELILGGEAPEPSSRRLSPQVAARRRSRRAFSLWVGVPVALLFVLVAAVFGGWASALQYHDVAEKNERIADREREWADHLEETARIERELREALEARDAELRTIGAEFMRAAAESFTSQRYENGLVRLEVCSRLVEAIGDRHPDLIEELSAIRRDVIVELVAHAFGEVDRESLDRLIDDATRPSGDED